MKAFGPSSFAMTLRPSSSIGSASEDTCRLPSFPFPAIFLIRKLRTFTRRHDLIEPGMTVSEIFSCSGFSSSLFIVLNSQWFIARVIVSSTDRMRCLLKRLRHEETLSFWREKNPSVRTCWSDTHTSSYSSFTSENEPAQIRKMSQVFIEESVCKSLINPFQSQSQKKQINPCHFINTHMYSNNRNKSSKTNDSYRDYTH